MWTTTNIPQGWQCPVCKGIFSPITYQCFNCTGEARVNIKVSAPAPSTEFKAFPMIPPEEL